MSEVEISDKQVLSAIKVGVIALCIVFACIFVITPIIGSYNALVDSDLQVQRAGANIKADLERRADLLPNLAETVKGSAVFEHNTLVEVTTARSLADINSLKEHIRNTDDISALDEYNSQMTSIYGNFVKLQEQYPELQSIQQFREFGAQVTATENQILYDRQTYNNAVTQYRSVTRTFPTNLIAGHFGFSPDRYEMYEPKDMERAETVPTITFDFNDM